MTPSLTRPLKATFAVVAMVSAFALSNSAIAEQGKSSPSQTAGVFVGDTISF